MLVFLEYYDEEDEYSHSVEDNYCISPSTAAQFTWTREKNMDFAAYVGQEAVINEEEEETQEDVSQSGCDSFNDSVKSAQLGLSELDQAKLNSCLEEARNILGDSVSETVMTSVIIQNGYNLETSINQLLSQQASEGPPPVTTASQDLHPKTEVISACTPLVTPSKSASKVTIGFLQAETQNSQPSSPASSKKLTLQVNRRNDASPAGNKKNSMKSELLNFSQSEMESKKSDVVTSEEGAISKTAMDCNLRNAVEFMGLEGDKDTIQSSVDAMKPIPATPKSKSKASKIDIMTEYAKRHGNKELLNLVVIGSLVVAWLVSSVSLE
ncbi:hypothetical protein Btru_014084 [Bulinus truncatus]|nr:hypothetical protein Btru_014084 [Bulinus truncatus]